jgi:GNAT superfamily N-acetyltransferase
MIAATEDLIRRAEPGDAETCGDILNAWIDDRDWMPRVHTAEDVRAFYRDFVLPNRQLWVTGDPVDGFLRCRGRDGHRALRRAAGAGDGQASSGFREGGARLTLSFQANTRARAFYAREGFREVRMTDGDNEEGLPDVLLEWVRDG